MSSNLLTTKFYIPPPRQGFIIRRRLLDRLDEMLSHKLTLVSAPAGFGKTTLLSIWAQEREASVAWLSLDPDDNDLNTFLRYLIAALQTISSTVGRTSLSMLQSLQITDKEPILGSLINDLALIQKDLILILDDYHLIDSKEIHQAISYLLGHLSPHFHLVIISRSDPPLSLSRLRARNQLLEIRQLNLRLNQQEVQDFLDQSMSLDLTKEQVEILEARTEGWIAGLQLAALSLRDKQDVDAFLESFGGSHRFIIDYLADEIFSQLPEDLRTFLRRTAVLDSFTAQLCNLVTGRSDSDQVLRELEEANLFLISLDDRREWFRFHHLFLDYLRTSSDIGDESELHIKASRWYRDHQFYSRAVNHALLSGDMDETVHAISRAAPIAIQGATFTNLSTWFDALPDHVITENGELALYKSFTLFLTQSYREAFPYALAAQKNFPAHAPSYLEGRLLCLKAHHAMFRGKNDDAIRDARDALEYLDDGDYFFRNLTFNVLGQILEMKNDVASAAEIYHQAFRTGSKVSDRIGSIVILTNLVYSLNELGRLMEAVDICREVNEQFGEQLVGDRPLSDLISMPWGMLSYEADQLEIAEQQAQRALDLLSQYGVSQGISLAQHTLALVYLAGGEFDKLHHFTQQGYQLSIKMGLEQTHGAWFTALQAQASLELGNLQSVEKWAEKNGFSPLDNPHHWVEYPYFTYTRLLLAQDRFEDARTLLNTMQSNAQQGGRLRKLITINLLQAAIDQSGGNEQQAKTRLETAVRIASPQGYYRAFLNEDPAILLSILPQLHHLAPQFVSYLQGTPDVVPRSTSQLDHLIDPLTQRELEVLQLVARGLSNREIADALYVTLGTVKKHLNNIFSKLDVKSRTQAVARGTELNLLD